MTNYNPVDISAVFEVSLPELEQHSDRFASSLAGPVPEKELYRLLALVEQVITQSIQGTPQELKGVLLGYDVDLKGATAEDVKNWEGETYWVGWGWNTLFEKLLGKNQTTAAVEPEPIVGEFSNEALPGNVIKPLTTRLQTEMTQATPVERLVGRSLDPFLVVRVIRAESVVRDGNGGIGGNSQEEALEESTVPVNVMASTLSTCCTLSGGVQGKVPPTGGCISGTCINKAF